MNLQTKWVILYDQIELKYIEITNNILKANILIRKLYSNTIKLRELEAY